MPMNTGERRRNSVWHYACASGDTCASGDMHVHTDVGCAHVLILVGDAGRPMPGAAAPRRR
eukprot:11825322-Alexandrium_andersonii.AAC.1